MRAPWTQPHPDGATYDGVVHYLLTGLSLDADHYIAVTAYSSGGLESDYSNEKLYRFTAIAPPRADAGPDLTGALDTTYSLGAAPDSGVNYFWEQVAGPPARLTDRTSSSAQVSASAAGTYELTLTAWTDDGVAARDTAVVVLAAAPPTPLPTVTTSATSTRSSTPTSTSTPSFSPMPTTTPTASGTPAASPTFTPGKVGGFGGRVRYYAGLGPVPRVNVAVNGAERSHDLFEQTDLAGQYTCSVSSGDWTIEPLKNGDVRNGVSALDAAYVLQAVVGMRDLSAAQRLACDVTGNGSLTSLDATRILQFAVGGVTRFPAADLCGSDWLFTPDPLPAANQIEIAPLLGEARCRRGAISLEPLVQPAAGQDFLATLLGDCTGNWRAEDGLEPQSVSADDPRIRFGRLRARGNRVLLSLRVHAPRGFHALEVQVVYDPAVLAVSAARLGPALDPAGVLLQQLSAVPGLFAVALASADRIMPGSRSVIELEFERLAQTVSPSAVQPVRVRLDEIDIAVQAQSRRP